MQPILLRNRKPSCHSEDDTNNIVLHINTDVNTEKASSIRLLRYGHITLQILAKGFFLFIVILFIYDNVDNIRYFYENLMNLW